MGSNAQYYAREKQMSLEINVSISGQRRNLLFELQKHGITK